MGPAQAGSPAGACRQGVLAPIVMIEAGEHDRSHYRNTAASVVRTCGPAPAPAADAGTSVPFDKAVCGKLALTMLEGVGESETGGRGFVKARDEFAGKCLAR